ncbi:MAG: SufD family Fe-S cluster assembly protein [Thermoleophilaceae bacterium]|nr:SufD family Fe-S cluster assembly protein [Thermoleophilaceae bacterium]
MPLSAIDSSRQAALELYESAPVPTWRRSGFWTTSLRTLKLEELGPKTYAPVASRTDLPEVVREALGDQPLAGLVVLHGGSVILTEISDEASAAGVVVSSLEDAFENNFEIAQAHYAKRIGHDEGKFSAANAALWTGGAFVYVPKNTAVELPIQVVNVITDPGTAQYARTLVVVDQGATAYVREYNVAPPLEGQALHGGALEVFVGDTANVKLVSLHDWQSGEIFDISTKRVQIGRDAHCSWFPIHLGAHLTKQTLDIITAEEGADMRHNGIFFTEGDEHLDLYSTDLHEKGHTTGDTVWKGVMTGRSRASYEGLIEIVEGAQGTNTYLQTHSVMLSPHAKVDAIPSLIVKTDDVSASHGGTVGEIDEDQVFYMRCRGISRQQAIQVLVEGFFEPIVAKLDDAPLETLVRARIGEKLDAAKDDIAAYAASK